MCVIKKGRYYYGSKGWHVKRGCAFLYTREEAMKIANAIKGARAVRFYPTRIGA